jgi:two-component system, response regulator YesN
MFYRVLLVEDETVIRKGLKKLIEELVADYRVSHEAINGREALQLLQQITPPPDLLVTDVRMPDMNGLELVRQVRQLPGGRDLPVLIISGHDDFEYAKTALRYGVADYLLKPVDRAELALFLENLKRRRADVPAEPPRAIKPENEPDKDKKVIRRIKELVQERLADEISLPSIASAVGLNAKYLSDLFKAETGQPFSDYVTHARMERARQLLTETNLKIYEVATLCGYSSAKHFTVAFRQATGRSPSEYRDG